MNRFSSVLIIVFFFLGLSCKSSTQETDPSVIDFLNRILFLEKLTNGTETDEYNLEESITIIEELTNIKSYVEKDYSDLKIPNIWNIQDWKEWYELNKKNIYYSKIENKFYVKGKTKYLKKDPKKRVSKI